MVGAAFLAGRSALFSGAGRVYVVRPSLADGYVLDAITPEVMVIDAMQSKSKPIDAWVAGPGLGVSDAAHQLLSETLGVDAPLVLDADALNLIAEDPALARKCARRSAPTVATPHPGEAARLLACDMQTIQADRTENARQLAGMLRATAILKGHHTVIAHADGGITINDTGNAALATAGTGDVLAGMLGALIAQGMPVRDACAHAVRIHGLAAERLADQVGGMVGITAGELIPEIRRLINQ
jgi:hydroxyethylthiazole kinase-like uncharacterized protein yjeF